MNRIYTTSIAAAETALTWRKRCYAFGFMFAAAVVLLAFFAAWGKWQADDAADLRRLLDAERSKCAPAPIRKSMRPPEVRL